MGAIRTIVGLGLMLSMTATPAFSGPSDGERALASVGGHKLTESDLVQSQAGKLLAARYAYYQAERQALDAAIDDYLLQQQAQKENMTLDQLVNREFKSKVKTPSEDSLHVVYDSLKVDHTRYPYSLLHDRIVERVRDVQEHKIRTAYVKALRDKEKIQVLLEPPSAKVEVGSAPTRGGQNAPVVLIEFADFECPYCRRVAPDLKKLEEQFGPNLKVAYKDFPLPMHHHAEKAAEAARCASAQGQFWAFHDNLFGQQGGLEVDQLKALARTLKLDGARFDKCLDSGEQAGPVHQDLAEGQRLGLNGTPSFFVNGHFISGANYDSLHQLIEQELAARGGSAVSGGL